MSESDKNPSNKTLVSNKKKSPKPESSEPSKSLRPSGYNLYLHIYSTLGNFITSLKKYLNTNSKEPSTSNDLSKLFSTAEKVVRDSYDGIVKKVTDFAENDLKKLKTLSEEEAEKTKKILLQYAAELQRISEEKLKKLLELKKNLQTKINKTEELHSIAKFFDAKISEMKKLSEEVCKSLSRGETLSFVKDVQKMVETQSNMLKTSMNSLIKSTEESIPKIHKSLKSITSQDVLSRMSEFANSLKLSSVSISKMFDKKKPGYVSDQGVDKAAAKKPMVSLKNGIQFYLKKFFISENIHRRVNRSTMGHAEEAGGEQFKGLAKYFNSTTNTGRANVSKATYVAVALIGAYFYLKPSKKAAPK